MRFKLIECGQWKKYERTPLAGIISNLKLIENNLKFVRKFMELNVSFEKIRNDLMKHNFAILNYSETNFSAIGC